MADFGISIAERLIEVIGCSLIKEICDVWGYKSELEELNKTVCIIKNVLLEAESKRELITNNERDYVDELKAVAYDADDLFDEFLTLAHLKQLDVGKKTKFSKKVRNFFSLKKKEVTQAYRMSHQVKDIKKQLDVIVNKRNMFNLSFDYQPIINRKEETCSYVDVNAIIGRETDKKAVIDMLLAPNKDVEDNFRFVTIVGVGGLGKTALAQLVYNDDEVKKEFSGESALRCWVCVSDQDGEQFDLKSTLCKILDSVSGEKPSDALSLESVKNQFQLRFSGKKYLLILDDLWNEDLDKWLEFKKFLTLGQGGSRIVVTTRSERTSKVVVGDDKHMHKLGGLSEEDSWSLFEMIAFINRNNEDVNHLELVEIGKSIVRKCYNNPLVIKVVGSLLFDQGVSTWRLFEEKGLSEIGNIGNDGNNKIMSILKFSYYNLRSSLKSCFSYCAIFPKDTRIEKHELISLWMAQGFVVPFHGCQSIDDAAEEHFLILLRRCFFQDVERDDMGDIMSVKIHDLMHDVAQEVGRGEICVSSFFTDNVGAKIRHVHYIGDGCSEKIIFKSKIRSFICKGPLVDKQLDNWMCLRVMVMTESSLVSLPDSIGKLLHLRYLDLSGNSCLETLPDSITELHNLETLILCDCEELRELPVNFSRLLNLRHLDLTDCDNLVNMPAGMNKLSSLRLLPFFAVGRHDSILDGKQCKERLESLKTLTNIKGRLEIRIGENYRIVEGKNNDSGGDYLKGMKHLTEVVISFDEERVVVPLPDEYKNEYDHPHEYVLEKLEPPSSIKEFRVFSFDGYKIPKWGRAVDNWGAISFPCLVKIVIEFCKELKQMPSLAELPYLKCIILKCLYKLEYMENRSEGEILKPIYPSLEVVKIYILPKLTGWWRGEGGDITRTFPRLSELSIIDCESLKTFPPCPSLEYLELIRCNDATGVYQDGVTRLKSMSVDKVDYLKVNFGIGIPWKSLNASLLYLDLLNVSNKDMQIAMNGVQYLTSLQTLGFYGCHMEALPEWISNLLSLRTLYLRGCRNLKSLPDSMKKLTSLQTLRIAGCVEIEEKLKPEGEDWPNIKHIPNIYIGKGDKNVNIIRNRS